MKALKIFIICSLLITMTSAFQLNKNVSAAETNVQQSLERVYISNDGKVINLEDIEVGEYAVTGVAIFVGGVIFGYVADGVIKYTTGHSAADWVAMGLSGMEAKIKKYVGTAKTGKIHVSSNGQLSGCVTYPCAITRSASGE